MEAEPEFKAPRRHFWGNTPAEEFDYYAQYGVNGSSSFFKSPRGLNLFARSWLPPLDVPPPKALLLMFHGYGNDVSWTFQMTPIFLASKGFACFAFDLEGHGLSDGLCAFIPDFDTVIVDAMAFLGWVRNNHPGLQNLPCFLYGESMGGTMALLTHFADPSAFRGAILAAPICKISDHARPRWPIPEVLQLVAKVLPTLPIVPIPDLMEKSVKCKEKKALADMNPVRYRGKPRLGTALDLLRVIDQLSQKLGDVNIPFIVLHGSDDSITDLETSRALYEAARSSDKTLKIYEGMLHSLTFGDTDENIEKVWHDVLLWLEDRCHHNPDPVLMKLTGDESNVGDKVTSS